MPHPDYLPLTASQVTEWVAFSALRGGFGEERADLRSADIARSIFEVNRDPRARSIPYRLDEFLLKPRAKRSPKQWVGYLKHIFRIET